jgi:hypothetical protein
MAHTHARTNLSNKNLELKNSIMMTRMFYDGFRDEMRNKLCYDSDEEAEKNWQEILKKFVKYELRGKVRKRNPSLKGPFVHSASHLKCDVLLENLLGCYMFLQIVHLILS